MSPVYMGKKPCCYQEDSNYKFTDQDNSVGLLQDFLKDHTNKEYPDFKVELDEKIDLDGQRKIILTAGVIINNEMEENKKDFPTSKLHLDYFRVVKELLHKYTDETKLKEFSKIEGFNNLLSRVRGI